MKINTTMLIFSFILVLGSCGKIEDEYQFTDESSVSWEETADKTSQKLIDAFWNKDGYFNYGSDETDLGFQYWPNAHAMDVVIDDYLRTNDEKYRPYFDRWFEGIKLKNGGSYYNNYYDDMQWNALTFLRLHEITKDQKYLDATILLWEDIIKGWNTEFAGGGIAWKKDLLYSKNACSNGPASILAARLYKVTKNQTYLDWAIKIYEWEKEVLFDRSTGAVYDHFNGQTDVIARFSLTYNQGTFLGTAVELYNISKDPIYLNDAQKIVNYTITKCIDASNNVLRHEGIGDGAMFKGIFIRYFVQYLLVDEISDAFRSKFENFFLHNAKTALTLGTDHSLLLFSPSWTEKPSASSTLTCQASAAMLFEGLAHLRKHKP
ncbi:glycoside hydrolase family 76 protein [Sphingobacterium sp. HJSM2_6]|uniref:glycoside hydrolase family 76 protein n=1 Tax=Sphingobacterium sp. HJSM2_6 TaxID=3366264 RepID=UPI003BC5AC4B